MCAVLGAGGEYREHQFVVATGVVNRTCEGLSGEGKIILKRI